MNESQCARVGNWISSLVGSRFAVGPAAGLALAAGMMAGTALAADVYVATNATPAAPYNTWATAFTNLQQALDYAGSADTIYLAGHTFSGPASADTVFTWQNATDVALRGGYRADPALDVPAPGLRDSATYPTILRRTLGDGSVLKMSAVSDAVIEESYVSE